MIRNKPTSAFLSWKQLVPPLVSSQGVRAALGSSNSRWLWGQAATSQGALRSPRKPLLRGWRLSAQAAVGADSFGLLAELCHMP